MATSPLALLKPGLKTAFAEALYNEILSNTNNYYYFIGKALEWTGSDEVVVAPENTLFSDSETRRDMIFLKKVTSADVAFTVPRYDWIQGNVYDMYDDRLGDQIIVAASAAGANFSNITGTFDLSTFGVGWLVTGSGIAAGTYVSEASGSQVRLTKPTAGPVTEVTFTNVSPSGATSLDTAKFYVLTNDNNVYMCLDNNNGSPSTVKPYSTTHESVFTDDGYVWKFMYTIPNSLANKFVSQTDIPVTTAVNSTYYSNGSISAIRVLNYGSGYSDGDELVLSGDGHTANNIYRLLAVTVENSGYGYVEPPDVVISSPFDTVNFEEETDYLAGEYLVTDENKIYLVVTGGTTGTSAPFHTETVSQSNGTTSLRFVGLAASGTASLSDTAVSTVALEGFIGFINVAQVGSGYDPEDPPEVVITGDGEGASATARVTADGHIRDIIIQNRGIGYTEATVSIDAPISGDQAVLTPEIYRGFGYNTVPTVAFGNPFDEFVEYAAGALVDEGDIVRSGSRFYEVVSTGANQELSDEPPVHNDPDTPVAYGDVELDYVGETASGSMFVEETRARVNPIIVDGQIVGAVIEDAGIGYTTASITAVGEGTGAVLDVDLSLGDLNTRQANTELLAVPGTIDAIDVLHPGISYAYANVEVVGDGSGCTAEAIIEDGAVVKINVTNPGQNYTQARVIITGNPAAQQAYARAIISPLVGHGRNAVRQLFAKDITFSTTISRDRNQGFIVSNDYRQLGLIKNPEDPVTGYRLNRFTASTCHVIAGAFPYDEINADDVLTDIDGNRFFVIAKPPEEPVGVLSLLVLAADNINPVVGGRIFYGEGGDGNSVALTSVTNPTADKYSGDIMFINNRASFQPTDEQTVSIKTVIRL
jgi:hypothetical protein